jgi:hypothetical protein
MPHIPKNKLEMVNMVGNLEYELVSYLLPRPLEAHKRRAVSIQKRIQQLGKN